MRVVALLCCMCCALTAAAQERSRTEAPVVSEILATQIALDRAGFSPGEIDGRDGANLQRARTAYEPALRDAHLAPRRRYAKALDALEGRAIANDSPGVIDVRESLFRHASPNDPPITHTTAAKASSGPPPYI